MILVIGGAYQGKRAWAKKNIGDFESGAAVYSYHERIRDMTEKGIDAEEYTRRLCEDTNIRLITLDEVGMGIVPADKTERMWRELVGRCGCILAESAEAVYRVSAGIGVKIK